MGNKIKSNIHNSDYDKNEKYQTDTLVDETKINNYSNYDKDTDKDKLNIEESNKMVQSSSIGNYIIIKYFGKGVFSKVFLCHIKDNSSKLYAAKRISKNKILKNHILNNIYNEKNILDSLNNEFIIKLIGIEQTERKIFMIFDYYKYGDLFTYLKHFKYFSEDITKFIILQIYLAFEYLHSKNIIYRDIKPENIIVDDDGYVKLIDFGLSKQLSDDNSKIFEICGTNEFIPPEVIQNNGYGFNFDWWGFGVLTYELLLGEPPFKGKTQKDIFKNILHQELDFDHCGKKKIKGFVNKIIKQIGVNKKKKENEISEQAKNFIELLLMKDPDERMFPSEILKHAFLKESDIEMIKKKKLESPLKKLIQENIDNFSMNNRIEYEDLKSKSLKKILNDKSNVDQELFEKFK